MGKLDLQLAQFLLVGFALHLHLGIAANRPFLCHDVVHFMQGTFANADRLMFHDQQLELTAHRRIVDHRPKSSLTALQQYL